ncbi:MAG: hypothetical protein KRP56_05155 [Candidatus Methanogranum gryphiswaldense]|nr:MAG: hypothetical protein KRP56_05155 [Candidatus Methanogranum sp. U3.2.1]
MSKQKANSKEIKSDKYQPKATVRHDKIAKSRKDELLSAKEKIANDRYMAKKAEARRRKAIKDMPKEERGPAKTQLKEDIVRRKAAHKEAKEKYKADVAAERVRIEAEEEEESEKEDKKASRAKTKKDLAEKDTDTKNKTSKNSKEVPAEESTVEAVPKDADAVPSEEPKKSSVPKNKKN